MVKQKGIYIILSSPSGAGKTSLAKKLLKKNKNFELSVSYTTRKKRPKEINKKDYHFISKKELIENPYNISKYWLKAQEQAKINKGNVAFLKNHNALVSVNGNEFTNENFSLASIYIIRDPRDVVVSNAHYSNLAFDKIIQNLCDKSLFYNLSHYHDFPDIEFLGVMLWQWIYFAFTFVLFLAVAIIITRIITFILAHLKVPVEKDIIGFINGPVSLLLAVFMARSLNDQSNVTIAVMALFHGATVLLIAWGWICLRAVDLAKHRLSQRFIRQDKPQAIFLLRPISNVAKTLIVISLLFMWFENLGFNATTLLAGLGIGGLAIALAAQKTVENIIAAITLYISAPVKIGSLCKFGSQLGTVEEIGLRATRIRTLDRSVIYVANAKFVDMQLENVSERERISYRPKLMLSANTKQQNLMSFMQALRELLEQHKHIAFEPCRVRFKGFTPWALQVDVLSYVETVDFAFYMEVIEELNLAILGLLNEHECELANPEFARVAD